jgi:hypothetical protein
MEPGYAGSRNTINQQINGLAGETQAQVGGLTAQAEQSHSDILDGARRRGMGFSGVPIGEQVKYDSTVFKPALAGLYSSQNARKTSLEESLNSLYRDQRNGAMGIQQQETAADEQRRQFDANMAFQREQMMRQEQEAARNRAAASAASSSAGIGSYFGVGSPPAAAPKSSTPAGFRSVLQQAANSGNNAAKIALKFVGDDGKYWFDPTKRSTGYSQEVLAALDAIGAKNAYVSTRKK